MRSKAVRDEIKFTLKEPPTASLGKKADATTQLFGKKNQDPNKP